MIPIQMRVMIGRLTETRSFQYSNIIFVILCYVCMRYAVVVFGVFWRCNIILVLTAVVVRR